MKASRLVEENQKLFIKKSNASLGYAALIKNQLWKILPKGRDTHYFQYESRTTNHHPHVYFDERKNSVFFRRKLHGELVKAPDY